MKTRPARPILFGSMLLLAFPALMLLALAFGETGYISPAALIRFLFAGVAGDAGIEAQIAQLRLYRALCAAGAGGALALGGALAQGLFRNPLAEPGLLGVSGGAALGAMTGIAFLGGYGSHYAAALAWNSTLPSLGLLTIPLLSLLGAFAAALFVYRWSSRQGNISIATFLLTGLALNSLAGALMALLQMLLLDDFEITRAMLSWGFGTFNDRSAAHVWIVWSGVACALAAVPFLGLELDLLASGEEDARALGANVARVKLLALLALALATASAVSVCGQIAFVGLLVPHAARFWSGPRHRPLMLNSFLLGALLLLGVVVFQNGFCPWLGCVLAESGSAKLSLLARRLGSLQPGIMTSLIGAPFFMLLLLRQNSGVRP